MLSNKPLITAGKLIGVKAKCLFHLTIVYFSRYFIFSQQTFGLKEVLQSRFGDFMLKWNL